MPNFPIEIETISRTPAAYVSISLVEVGGKLVMQISPVFKASNAVISKSDL
jgi:hypothetical protein